MEEPPAKQKLTRRERFLREMDAAVPWARLVGLIEPFYPKGERGRPPPGVERMLRVYFLQQWYALADEALEDVLSDSRVRRAFVGGDLVPAATTLLKFRHLLERHGLTERVFTEVNALPAERGAFLRWGTIVDATIIAAAPSTKHKAKARDPDLHQTRKGNSWHFGRKAQHRRGRRLRVGAPGGGHRRQRGPGARPVARARKGRLWRRGLPAGHRRVAVAGSALRQEPGGAAQAREPAQAKAGAKTLATGYHAEQPPPAGGRELAGQGARPRPA